MVKTKTCMDIKIYETRYLISKQKFSNLMSELSDSSLNEIFRSIFNYP